jgi:hypothetical protein
MRPPILMIARRAGTEQAASATISRIIGTDAKGIGSLALAPHNRLDIGRVSPNDATRPITTPVTAHAEGIRCPGCPKWAGGLFLPRRFTTSFIVNWLADFKVPSSFHSSGSATGAPGRARTA